MSKRYLDICTHWAARLEQVKGPTWFKRGTRCNQSRWAKSRCGVDETTSYFAEAVLKNDLTPAWCAVNLVYVFVATILRRGEQHIDRCVVQLDTMIEEPPRMPRTVTFKVERCKECRPAPCFVCEPRAGGTPGRHFSGSTETVHKR